ncbi:DgyrCDS6338 [Dimorphilus gyrociliatus]|uniref:DgyrCDS6338 n=1 Tax=Dimorphilus gyrociliatus TaxID=2664684 RepID=A0A7I8VSJ5_9ANNE|nr:DgyrCDS6338 [Dimorphilus gyrociliatus]
MIFRRRRRFGRSFLSKFLCLIIFIVVTIAKKKLFSVDEEQTEDLAIHHPGGRHLLQTTLKDNNISTNQPNCTIPAYHEFPTDLFSNEQRSNGAVIIHVFVVVYIFIALAIICDEYFVASLEKICEKLKLSEDVAGATFMAAGSSAPELFTSVIGVFIAHGDVGIGTIVGSAVFNILFIIGLCGILVKEVVILAWYPLIRDTAFYLISVIALILTILDSTVKWYESFIMLTLYAAYIFVMKENRKIQEFAHKHIKIFDEAVKPVQAGLLPPSAPRKFYGDPNAYEMYENSKTNKSQDIKVLAVDKFAMKPGRMSFADICLRVMKGKEFKPKTRFKFITFILIAERKKLLQDPGFKRRQKQMKTLSFDASTDSYTKAVRTNSDKPETEKERPLFRPPKIEEGLLKIAGWLALLPASIVFFFTVPDCKRKRFEGWYAATFMLSIAWIAILSYIMVWMVTLIGYTMGIPDSIMGITFLAAGTSVPDAMSSVMVARQGMGDMAISNTIGSNVFDILIGLALPWFIHTVLLPSRQDVHINSNGMVFSVILLFATVVITVSKGRSYIFSISL